MGPSPQDDLQTLPSLTDSALLDALQQRHKERHVYTYSGPRVVVSVNPNDWSVSLPLYAEDVRARFHEAPEGDLSGGRRALPPHLYAVAEQARRRRASPAFSQALLVGGESGAGKTEAVKILMQYLCQAGAGTKGGGSGGGSATRAPSPTDALVERLVELNPLLEAFGNATTALNHNSSRFGKLITLEYADGGRGGGGDGSALGAPIIGGRISCYLLEKVRVVHHAEGEGGFHVFAQVRLPLIASDCL